MMDAKKLNIAIAQLNPTVGDVDANAAKIAEAYAKAVEAGADLMVTPELSITGCPLEDLVNDPDLLAETLEAAEGLRKLTAGKKTALAIGLPVIGRAYPENAVRILQDGKCGYEVRKNYTTAFDPFARRQIDVRTGHQNPPVYLNGQKMGFLIGDDVLHNDLVCELMEEGIKTLIAINADPYKQKDRLKDVLDVYAREKDIAVVYVNQVGAQDELVFDGGSFIVNPKGQKIKQLGKFKEDFAVANVFQDAAKAGPTKKADRLCDLWQAAVLATRDYMRKTGFNDVVLGLSGGVDSAIVAAIAGDALGAEHVHCLKLPSQFTAEISNTTADQMAEVWGMPIDTVPINTFMTAYEEELVKTKFGDREANLTEENLQARIRGNLIMAYTNEYGWLMLNTGNKSEAATGYSTLYGDTCGAFNPLKDMLKEDIFKLCVWRNENKPEGALGPTGEVIPKEIITRPPSAELRPLQLDEDRLPPYPVLDGIITEIVQKRTRAADILAKGYAAKDVLRVYRLIKTFEFKRRQEPPGMVTTDHAFGAGFTLPMVSKFIPKILREGK